MNWRRSCIRAPEIRFTKSISEMDIWCRVWKFSTFFREVKLAAAHPAASCGVFNLK